MPYADAINSTTMAAPRRASARPLPPASADSARPNQGHDGTVACATGSAPCSACPAAAPCPSCFDPARALASASSGTTRSPGGTASESALGLLRRHAESSSARLTPSTIGQLAAAQPPAVYLTSTMTGALVAAVTAKDKLRTLLGHGLKGIAGVRARDMRASATCDGEGAGPGWGGGSWLFFI